MSILAALVMIGIVVWWLSSVEAQHDSRHHYNRGSAYAKKGDLDRAIADLTWAIELDPDGPMGNVARSHLKRLQDKGSN